MPSQLLTQARRFALAGSAGIGGLATYKAHTDPVHLFWDLDHTILCSVCPLPNDKETSPKKSNDSTKYLSIPSPPPLEHFDQIDDDFPYSNGPNTRTYFRPGARSALKLCSCFAIMHVYTAAQESYTNNILKELDPDRTLFDKVLHRDEYPTIVKEGKDLTFALDKDRLHRAILFDDKISNFKPQGYENGIGVTPYTSKRVENCLCDDVEEKWKAYLVEMKEMASLVVISFWSSVHFSGDVRKVINRVRRWGDGK